MRNMKKLLSVALAVMMMFTLVISASAKSIFDFGDLTNVDTNKENREYVDSNKYFEDALQLMVDLEVMAGRTDGNLGSADSINRLEFIVMLYKFTHEGQEAGMAYSHTFTDVPWGEHYVGWAQSSGVAEGIGNNMFGSSNKIKLVDALTFIIKALGINTEFEGFTGDNYAMKATVIADDLGLIRDFKVANPDALTRAEVATLFYFAAEAMMQEYQIEYIGGDRAVYVRYATNQTAISKFFGFVKYEGEVVANNLFALAGYSRPSNANVTRLQAHSADGINSTLSFSIPVKVSHDKIGHAFYVYAKFDKAGNLSKYSGFNISATETTYATSGLYFGQDSAANYYISTPTSNAYDPAKRISRVAVQTDADGDANIYKNYSSYTGYGNGAMEIAAAGGRLGASSNNQEPVVATGAAHVTEGNSLRMVNNGYNVYYFIEDLTAAKITRVSSTEYVTAKAAELDGTKKNIKIANVITDDEIEAQDYVLYANIAGSDYYTMIKADVLEGQATSYADGMLRIEGTRYSRLAVDGSALFYANNNSSTGAAKVSLAVDSKFYLVNDKVIAHVPVSSLSDTGNDYAYVNDAWRSGGNWQVEVYSATDPNGKVYTVHSGVNTSGWTQGKNTGAPAGNLFKYTASSDTISLENINLSGEVIANKALVLNSNSSLDAYTGTANMNGQVELASNYFTGKINAGSVFFMLSASGAVKVYTNRPAALDANSNLDGSIFLFDTALTGTGATTSNRKTAYVKAALLTDYTLTSPAPTYAWGISAEVNANRSGKMVVYTGGAAPVTINFPTGVTYNDDARGIIGGSVPLSFAPGGRLVKITYSGSSVSQIDMDDYSDDFSGHAGYAAYEAKFTYDDGMLTITDTQTPANTIWWDDAPSGMKFLLIDYTGDELVTKNVTSTIGELDLSDDSIDYTYIVEVKPDGTPAVLWIIME